MKHSLIELLTWRIHTGTAVLRSGTGTETHKQRGQQIAANKTKWNVKGFPVFTDKGDCVWTWRADSAQHTHQLTNRKAGKEDAVTWWEERRRDERDSGRRRRRQSKGGGGNKIDNDSPTASEQGWNKRSLCCGTSLTQKWKELLVLRKKKKKTLRVWHKFCRVILNQGPPPAAVSHYKMATTHLHSMDTITVCDTLSSPVKNFGNLRAALNKRSLY